MVFRKVLYFFDKRVQSSNAIRAISNSTWAAQFVLRFFFSGWIKNLVSLQQRLLFAQFFLLSRHVSCW